MPLSLSDQLPCGGLHGDGMASRSGKNLNRALILGLSGALAGVLLFVSPWGRYAEERFGLDWLFTLRGPIGAPPEVVLVSIDKASSKALGVPYDTSRWPRSLHTRLVRGLTAAGARSVTFDLHFRKPRADEDAAFASALRTAGNVVLLEFLEKDQPVSLTQADRVLPVTLQQRSPPTPEIASAAAGFAPFTLPKVPDQVSRFWTFDDNAGGVASLPLVTLAQYATPAYRLLRSDRQGATGIVETASASLVDRLASDAPGRLAQAMATLDPAAAPDTAPVAAFAAALRPPGSRYLNFYGPAQTVRTLSYVDALSLLETPEGRAGFAGKAVFVGVSSPVQWQQRDEFRTVYSDPETGMDLSGSEILATAFANLLHGNSLQPLGFGAVVALLLLWSLLVGLLVSLLRPWWALPVLVGLVCTYLVSVLGLFASQNLWLPTVVPLAVIAPLLLVSAAFWQHREAHTDLQRIQHAFGHYLPQTVVKRLVEEGYRPLEDRRSVYGVCLVTDAEGYTSIAEHRASEQLVDLINDYMAVIIGQIRQHGGEVSDIKGDSVMAFWASRTDDQAIRAAACRAMIDIDRALAVWNADNPHGVRLPTRIGLHCGKMTLARVGAQDHFEQRAVGDIVNTSARLEQLNKQLGTHLLMSAEAVQGVDDLLARNVGRFTVKGRTTPIVVYEALDWKPQIDTQREQRLRDFDVARLAYEQDEWDRASRLFGQLLAEGPGDPVASWYLTAIDAKRERTG